MTDMAKKGLHKLNVSRLRVVLNGHNRTDWSLRFMVQAQYDYKDG